MSYTLTNVAVEMGEEPLSYEATIKLRDSQKWQEAIQSEMDSLR